MSASSLKDRILANMKSAMKNRETSHLQALKLVYADCKNKEIELKRALDDAQVISLLKKQVKQYEESIEQCEKGGRVEGVREQKERMDLIKTYLPKALLKEELQSLVDKTIADLKATSVKEMGSVIKAVQSRAAGSADNRLLAELVRERLQAI